jgi:non-ribosomal peptide synthetase component F
MAPLGLLAAMVRAGIIAPLRPDKYLRIAAVARREGLSVTSGFAMSAQRCPNRPALIDELGTLTYRQLDQRGDALAFALQGLPGGAPEVVAIMCRNHRGFVEALVAADRIGADMLLLNTSFAGPALRRRWWWRRCFTRGAFRSWFSPHRWAARWRRGASSTRRPPSSSSTATTRAACAWCR